MNHSILHSSKQPSMGGVLGLYVLDAASSSRHCGLVSHQPWSTACVLLCLVLCAVMWNLTFCSHVQDLNTCFWTQNLAEDKPCSYPPQTQGWRAPRMLGQAMPLEEQTSGVFLAREHVVYTCVVQKTWGTVISVCMNGNLLLFGYQGLSKQAKMSIYANEI